MVIRWGLFYLGMEMISMRKLWVILLAVMILVIGLVLDGHKLTADDGRFGNQWEYTRMSLTTAASNYTISGSTNLKTYWISVHSPATNTTNFYFKPCGTTATSADRLLIPGATVYYDINCTQFSLIGASGTPVADVDMLKRGGI